MKKFLIGCGIIAGVGTLIVVLALAAAYSFLKRNAPDTKHAEQVREELARTYPGRDEYVPALDGALDPMRLERFTEVREAFAARAVSFGNELGNLMTRARAAKGENKPHGVAEKLRFGLDMARSGMRMASLGVRAVTVRDSLLLQAQMGEGEYTYLYCLTSFSWLGWDPMDTPGSRTFKSPDGDRDLEFQRVVEDFQDDSRRIMLGMLRAQRDSLNALSTLSPVQTSEKALWARELELSRKDRSHFPLSNALTPDQLAVLEPFETRLKASLPATAEALALEAYAVTKEFDYRRGSIHISDRDVPPSDD